jgi:TPP-dependent 2-oxoacid decarboxylase
MYTSSTNEHPQPAAAALTTTVAGYLFNRLAEAGVVSVFGVPGDYNLGLLDAVADRPAMAWAGMATEQGAGYAADSYARLRGLGALVTTFGVGELSALNAVAGAYAESVPVVHIVGTPALAARQDGTTLHHNLPGAGFGHFARMAAEVTVAQADLRPATAPAEIDRVLAAAVRASRPVYLTIPADVASAPVAAPAAPLQVSRPGDDPDPAVLRAFADRARRLLGGANTASVLVGHLAARYHVASDVARLAAAADLPVAVLSMAKGDFPETDPSFAGLYAGAASAKRARLAVEDTDVLITVGVTLADTVTGGGTHHLPVAGRIDLAPDRAAIGNTSYPGIGLQHSLAVLTSAVRDARIQPRTDLADLAAAEADPAGTDGQLTQRSLWASLQDFLLPGDLVIADQGTAFYGAAGLTLPEGAQLIGQPMWASIGWTLPAALGASLGAPDRRVVLVIGDGAMQQTAAELGTLLAQGAAPVIIVLNNGGYAIERAIHSPAATYHRIPQWDWTALPTALGLTSSPLTIRAASHRKLTRALRGAIRNAGRLILIEAVLDLDDAPPMLRDLTSVLAARNEYAQP